MFFDTVFLPAMIPRDGTRILIPFCKLKRTVAFFLFRQYGSKMEMKMDMECSMYLPK